MVCKQHFSFVGLGILVYLVILCFRCIHTDGEIEQKDLCLDLLGKSIFPLLADINRAVFSIHSIPKCALRKYREGANCSPSF